MKKILDVIGFLILLPFFLLFAALPLVSQAAAVVMGDMINEHFNLKGFQEVPIPFTLFILSCGYTCGLFYLIDKVFPK